MKYYCHKKEDNSLDAEILHYEMADYLLLHRFVLFTAKEHKRFEFILFYYLIYIKADKFSNEIYKLIYEF